ncbi:MAG TPA: N-acetylmuramoyl-L-alanine amidase [Acidimicrobiales bacterium]
MALAALAALGVAGCAGSKRSAHGVHTETAPAPSTGAVATTAAPVAPAATPVPITALPSTTRSPAPTTIPTTTTHAPPPSTTPGAAAVQATANGGPGTLAPTGSGVLNAKVVTIDPGHNGGNFADPSYINHAIFNGRASEACDTTGAETNSGYTEALFNWNLAQDVTADLRAEGATVVLTRTSNAGVGPCVTDRAAIGNNAHADAALSIHADGGPATGRGFAILEPVADGVNSAIVAPSQILGTDLRNAFLVGTGEPVSSYDGTNGIQPRNDLGGTNLSTVPKVFIECANMRNATDAALIVSPTWQARAAQAISTGLTVFLTRP